MEKINDKVDVQILGIKNEQSNIETTKSIYHRTDDKEEIKSVYHISNDNNNNEFQENSFKTNGNLYFPFFLYK